MKSCPTCSRTYTDASLNFCLEDGTPLVASAAPGFDPNATIQYTEPRDTEPPRPEVFRPAPPSYQSNAPVATHGSQFGQQQRSHLPVPGVPARKSSAVWWIVGGLLVVGVIIIGATVMIIALARMGGNPNTNSNRANVNSRIPNRNTNTNTNTNTNANANVIPASSLTDDFSEAKWGTGNYDFGSVWYADDEYHMRAKDKKYLVMYAPSPAYSTADSTVSVTVRSVDGTPAATGFGLIVHGEKKAGQLEDYALLIYTGDEPRYEIIKHKGGTETALVPWVTSRVIRSGSDSNQLEVRAKGSELTFYINGQFVNRITDSENFRGGIAGLYTSDEVDVAFDDLEIER